jgi:hypothetical protein
LCSYILDQKLLDSLLSRLGSEENIFTSSAHTSQHRLFGFITTNIRSPKSITQYIIELLPEFIKREKAQGLGSWEKWTENKEILRKHKQKFLRLEKAKILFRHIKKSPNLNDIGKNLYYISKNYGEDYLTFILNLYLLSGKYFDVEKQPLVEIEKILKIYKINVKNDIKVLYKESEPNRLLLASIFYNPSSKISEEIAFILLENEITDEYLQTLRKLIEKTNHLVRKRIMGAGGLGNFKSDVATIINYYLFKQSCLKYAEQTSYDSVVEEYTEQLFETNLNKFFNLTDKEKLKQILTEHRKILRDIFEFALGIKVDNNFMQRKDNLNVRSQAIQKYNSKCFFDKFAINDSVKTAHELNYFQTKKDKVYLEGRHMIQMENAKFFQHDIDIVENIIPVCPNCHRKLHNANSKIVESMVRQYCNNVDKKFLIKKGIFVDVETLLNFYGISEE